MSPLDSKGNQQAPNKLEKTNKKTEPMFIQVRLLQGFLKPLTYKVPDSWEPANLVGKLIRVPVRTQKRTAFVLAQQEEAPEQNH